MGKEVSPNASLTPRERVVLPLMVVGSFLFLHWYLSPSGVLDGVLPDSDGYHRLTRIQHFQETGDWFDDRLPRHNAPYGDRSYWTRPMDVLLIFFQTILRLGLPAEPALWWAGILISPILHLLVVLTFWEAAGWWMNERSRWLSLLVFVWGEAIFEQLVLGRADHHGLIHLSHLLMLGGTLAMIGGATESPPRSPGFPPASRLGWGAAFGLWVSMECSAMLGLLTGGLLLWWWMGIIQATEGPRLAFLRLALGLVLALLVERSPATWLEVQYDRLSVVHVWAGLILAGIWTALAHGERGSPPRSLGRTAWLTGTALAGFLLIRLPFPRFFQGPIVEIGPQMQGLLPLFLDMRPLWPLSWGTLPWLVLLAGPVLAGAPLILWYLREEWPRVDRARMLFLVIPLPFLVVALLTHMRMAVLLELFLPFAAGPTLDWFLQRTQGFRWPLARAAAASLAVFSLTLGPYVGSALVRIAARSARPTPSSRPFDPRWVKSVCEDLNDPAIVASPTIVVAWLNYGPQIVCRTRHGVVGTPIHRNERGLADTVTVFGSTDEEAIRQVFRERGASLFLHLLHDADVIMPGIGPPPAGSLPDRLNRGEVPAWLHPVPLVRAASTPFRLYAVDPGPGEPRGSTQ